MADAEKCTPEQVLMNCLAEAERIDQIIVIVYTKDGWYESWSNDQPTHVRLGLLREAQCRCEENYKNSKSEEDA